MKRIASLLISLIIVEGIARLVFKIFPEDHIILSVIGFIIIYKIVFALVKLFNNTQEYKTGKTDSSKFSAEDREFYDEFFKNFEEHRKDMGGSGSSNDTGGVNAPENKRNSIYFEGCQTLDDIKKRYKQLAAIFHPDNGTGDEDVFKAINTEYEARKATFENL